MLDISWRNKIYYYFYLRDLREYREEDEAHKGINYKIKFRCLKSDQYISRCEITIQIEIPIRYEEKLFTPENPYYSNTIPFLNRQDIDDIGHSYKNIYLYKNKFVYAEFPYYISALIVWYPKETHLTINAYQESHRIARWMIDRLLDYDE